MSIAVQEPSKRSLEMLLCQHGGKIIQPSLRKAEGLLSLRYALMWLLNQDKRSQTSKQGCIIHLPPTLVPPRIQLYPTAQPPASHFPQKTAKLCRQHTGDKTVVGKSKTSPARRQELPWFREALLGAGPKWGPWPQPQLLGLSHLPAVPDKAAISSSLARFTLSLLWGLLWFACKQLSTGMELMVVSWFSALLMGWEGRWSWGARGWGEAELGREGSPSWKGIGRRVQWLED